MLILRDVREADLPVFFVQQQDAEAQRQVAFSPRPPDDRAAFDTHWEALLKNDQCVKQTIEVDGEVAGNIGCFLHEGSWEVGYWLGKSYWGRGIGTEALTKFLATIPMRPIRAGVAKDNIASRRVLEKAGFRMIGEASGYSPFRACMVDELIYELTEDHC
ncbi:MAG TPA: GNAT family N-acetyltransferase [Gemmatimonadaceae bacterium]|nr:GNAT family N-acetyltransferase [Gemmatimonadaceae bacterium]